MTSFGDTVDALARYRAQWESLKDGARTETGGEPGARGGLAELTAFGVNPGDLRAFVHIPASLPPNAPLVVALHGCTQSASAYQRGSGWSSLADRNGFAVLYPEQTRGNNAQLCFNWFQPEDTARDRGESASIIAMIDHLIDRHRLDRRRVFATGLSAGGAMTASLLATYPDVFAAGTIIAGLPHGAASSMRDALGAMMSGDTRPDEALVGAARAAAAGHGSWPRVSIWHGETDSIVNPANADALIRQWTGLHGLAAKPSSTSSLAAARRSVWLNDRDEPLVERWSLPGFGHAAPTDASRCGEPGSFFTEAGLSATWQSARSWGLVANEAAPRASAAPVLPALANALPDIGGIIKKALRAAGL